MLEVLRSDASLQIDEILDMVETQLTSSEVFTAIFELEMAGRVADFLELVDLMAQDALLRT